MAKTRAKRSQKKEESKPVVVTEVAVPARMSAPTDTPFTPFAEHVGTVVAYFVQNSKTTVDDKVLSDIYHVVKEAKEPVNEEDAVQSMILAVGEVAALTPSTVDDKVVSGINTLISLFSLDEKLVDILKKLWKG